MSRQEIIHRDADVVDVEVRAPKGQQPVIVTPLDMLNRALERGDPQTVAGFQALYERWQAAQARNAFNAAMSKAKAEMPAIVKGKPVSFGAGKTSYKHETLDAVLAAVQPVLSRHGVDIRFRTESQPGTITVVCRLVHDDGHSEENSLTAPVDTSGSKNAIQAIGSAQTYLQRYTLKAALGLAATDDDDGCSAGTGETITDQQAHRIMDMLNEDGADLAAFCRYMRVSGIAEIPAKRFDEAVKAINTARAARARKGAQS